MIGLKRKTYKNKSLGKWIDRYSESYFVYRGYECVIFTRSEGYRTCYISIPKGHPLFEKDRIELSNEIKVHGKFSYAELGKDFPKKDENWWIGFDTRHKGDATDPEIFNEWGYDKYHKEKHGEHAYFGGAFGGTIRDLGFCTNELKNVVDQICDKYY